MPRICMLLTTTPWGDQRQFYKQAPALADAGYDLVFMAGSGGQEEADGFRYDVLSGRTRRLSRMTGAVNLIGRVLRWRPKVLQLCSLEQLPLGLVLKLFTGVKVVYDCREDMYHSMLHSKTWFPRPLRWCLAWLTRVLEYAAARLFDGLVVSDPALYRMHAGARPERKVIFYNTPLLRQFGGGYLPLAARPYDIVLMGGMTKRSGIGVLTEAVHLLAAGGRRVRLLLIGRPDPDDEMLLRRVFQDAGMAGDVTVTGWIPYDRVPEMLIEAKIGLVTLLDQPKFRKNIACKAFEYMACGMPCVCSDLPPQRVFIREGENGLFYRPGDAEGLADRIALLLDDPARAAAMGETGRQDVERYWNAERDQEVLRGFYRRLLGGPGSVRSAGTAGGAAG